MECCLYSTFSEEACQQRRPAPFFADSASPENPSGELVNTTLLGGFSPAFGVRNAYGCISVDGNLESGIIGLRDL
jgi:hypothetical protein